MSQRLIRATNSRPFEKRDNTDNTWIYMNLSYICHKLCFHIHDFRQWQCLQLDVLFKSHTKLNDIQICINVNIIWKIMNIQDRDSDTFKKYWPNEDSSHNDANVFIFSCVSMKTTDVTAYKRMSSHSWHWTMDTLCLWAVWIEEFRIKLLNRNFA